jgi:hypothetical protein
MSIDDSKLKMYLRILVSQYSRLRILLINSNDCVSVETRIARSFACTFSIFGIIFAILLIIVEICFKFSLLLIDVLNFYRGLCHNILNYEKKYDYNNKKRSFLYFPFQILSFVIQIFVASHNVLSATTYKRIKIHYIKCR